MRDRLAELTPDQPLRLVPYGDNGKHWERPEWQQQALCRGSMKNGHCDWFADPADDLAAARAKAICARCPVRVPCEKAGQGEREGIWGGQNITLRVRASLRRYCELCRTEFEYVYRGGGVRRFCSTKCQHRAAERRRGQAR